MKSLMCVNQRIEGRHHLCCSSALMASFSTRALGVWGSFPMSTFDTAIGSWAPSRQGTTSPAWEGHWGPRAAHIEPATWCQVGGWPGLLLPSIPSSANRGQSCHPHYPPTDQIESIGGLSMSHGPCLAHPWPRESKPSQSDFNTWEFIRTNYKIINS